MRAWLAADRDRQILCLLDEADAFLEVDSVLSFRNVAALKELLDTTGRAFKPVFAGLHQVQRFQSISNQPLAHLGEHIAIGPLAPQPAHDLASAPLQAVGYEFDDDDLAARLLNHTNYQPGIIQLFCHALVRHLLDRPMPREGAPPYRITAEDIERVYADPHLIAEIRKRFEWTISLDSSYKVIAYVMAHAAAEAGADHRMTVEQLREACQYWWPAGFAGKPTGEFKALVEEMVGLGVLAPRPGDARSYGMRSPNVLRMLGGPEDIERVLLEAELLEPQQRFDMAAFRRPLPGDDDRRSPLTEQQISTIVSSTNNASVVLGSTATGMNDVLTVLRDAAAQRSDVATTIHHLRPETGKLPAELRKILPGGHRIVVVDCRASSPDQIRRAQRQTAGAVGEARADSLSTVMLIDPSRLVLWSEVLHHDDPFVTANVLELGRWGAPALRVWHNSIELPLNATDFIRLTWRPPAAGQSSSTPHTGGGATAACGSPPSPE